MTTEGPRGSLRRARSRNWIWFFAVLAFLGVLAVTILGVYNLRQQLKPEQVEAARSLWEEKGPRSYDLEYTVVKPGSAEELYLVQVRGRRTVKVTLNGRPLEERLYRDYGMGALLDQIDAFLEHDARPESPRTFAKALFDPGDGHLVHYVRSVRVNREHLEITVTRLDPAGT